MSHSYLEDAPTRAQIDALEGPIVLEFGASWCGYCQAAQPLIAQVLNDQTPIRHLKIADGKGYPLGRSFKVKLWPTLIFLNNGEEIARIVRPTDVGEVRDALARIQRSDT